MVIETNRMTVNEAAEELGYHAGSIRRLIADGKLPAQWDHEQDRWMIDPADIASYRPDPEGQPSPALRDYPVPAGYDLSGRYRGRVKEYLPDRGYTVKAFAEAMGVDYSLVFLVDNGKRAASPAYRAKACALLEYPEATLFYPAGEDDHFDEDVKSGTIPIDN